MEESLFRDKTPNPFDVMNQRVQEKIEVMKDETDNVLQLLEQNYRNFLEAQITHHRYLMEMAEESKDAQRYSYHKVMFETYQATLVNLNSSGKFGRV